MTLRSRARTARDRAAALADRGPPPASVARWSLGLMLAAAGAHKLLDPSAWTVYVTDWLEPWLVVSPTAFMAANGVLELAFAALLLADRRTALAALVAAASLTATACYLAVAYAATGQFGASLARDVGLAGLAWTVLAAALQKEPETE